LHDWAKNFIADCMHVFKNVFGDFQEDDIILEVLLVKLVRADTQDDEALALILVDDRSLGR
jgi:hypothetical protein